MVDMKNGNPKDGIGLTKAALSCVPIPPLYECALAMMEGSLKYGRHNYRAAGIRYSVYFDAICRHLMSWWEGEDQSPDAKVHHLGHVMACCSIMLDDVLSENPLGIDDRPPETFDTGWLAEFNRRVAELKKKYPEAKEPFTP